MVLVLAMTTLLAQAPDAGEPLAVPLLEITEPDPGQLEYERALRIGVTLAGGAVGIALPLLIGFGIRATQAPCPMFSMCDGAVGAALMFLPATLGVGLGVPHALANGRAGVGFGLAGAIAGYATGLALLELATAAGSRVISSSPAATGVLVSSFTLIGAVAALELRHHGLENGYAKPWRPVRMLLSSLVYGIGSGLPGFGIFLFGAALVFGPARMNAITTAIFAGLVITDIMLGSLAAWGVHRALDGGGKFWAALTGGLVSATVGSLLLAAQLRSIGSSWTIVPASTLLALVFSVGPAVGLEWTSNVEAPKDANAVRLQPGFALAPGGGLLTLGGAF